MTRKELTKELHNTCEEHLIHGTTGWAYYSPNRGYYDNWYAPKYGKVIPFDENYNIARIVWHPNMCHGIYVHLKHKNYKDVSSSEKTKTLFWLSDNFRITNKEISRMINNIKAA